MKTSTKILIGYAVVVVAMQVVFLIHSKAEYRRTLPQAEALCGQIAVEGLRVVDITVDAPMPDYLRKYKGKELAEHMPWVVTNAAYKRDSNEVSVQLYRNLSTSRMENGTLYIQGEYLDRLWIWAPGLESWTIRFADKTVTRKY